VRSQTSTRSKFASAPLFRVAELGLSHGAISARVQRGELHRIHRGVYSLVPRGALTQEARWLAALMAAGEGAVLSHLAAAALWRATRWPPAVVDITVPRYRRSFDDVRVHQCRNLDPRDVTVHRGIPVTTVARMCVDLTERLIAEELTNVIHEAAFRRRLVLRELRETMARANGRRRLGVLEEALALWQQGSAGIKSRLERAFFALVVAAGLPKPVPNVHVEGIEVDAFWPGTHVVAELDGPNHTRPASVRADGSRDAVLRAAGYTVLRFSEHELDARPGEVVARVISTLPGCPASSP